MKHIRSILITLLIVLMALTISHLYFERALWKLNLELTAADAGRLHAAERFQWRSYLYYRVDANSGANFTGELIDGLELWNYPIDFDSRFRRPGILRAETYVNAFNVEMRRLVSALEPSPSAIKMRSHELQIEDWKRRQNAASMLGMIGDAAKDAVPDLIVATRDEVPEVRATAAWALGEIGPGAHNDEVVTALEEIKKIPNAQMQAIASKALEKFKRVSSPEGAISD